MNGLVKLAEIILQVLPLIVSIIKEIDKDEKAERKEVQGQE